MAGVIARDLHLTKDENQKFSKFSTSLRTKHVFWVLMKIILIDVSTVAYN